MTNEEFDRRLKGVTETLEIVAAMQAAGERRMDAFGQKIEQINVAFDRLYAATQSLLQIAESHERRISRLEDGGSNA